MKSLKLEAINLILMLKLIYCSNTFDMTFIFKLNLPSPGIIRYKSYFLSFEIQ